MRSSKIFKSSFFLLARDIVALYFMGSGSMGCIEELGAYTMGLRELLPKKVMTPMSVSPK
jgi:hypothetical protein